MAEKKTYTVTQTNADGSTTATTGLSEMGAAAAAVLAKKDKTVKDVTITEE